jgi:hypothetical protein
MFYKKFIDYEVLTTAIPSWPMSASIMMEII